MPEDEPLHQPHDKLFKIAFGTPKTAVAAFRAYLPERLWRHLDLKRAKLVPGSYIDEQVKTRLTDLLYRIPRGDSEVFVYFLFEHQAQEDRWMPQRLLSYMCSIWEEFRRNYPQAGALPVIVPLVLAQQKTDWRQPPNFAALFDLTPEQQAAYAEVIPDFTFQLLALAKLPFDHIVGTPMGVITLRVLKAHSSSEWDHDMVWDEPLLCNLANSDYAIAIRYLYFMGGLDKKTFTSRVSQLKNAKLRTNAMTLAEQFIQEGVEKGREEGILIGRIHMLQDLLHRPQTPGSNLSVRSLGELQKLYEELRRALP